MSKDKAPCPSDLTGIFGVKKMSPLCNHLLIPNRVEFVAQIARKADSNPFAAMKALQKVDDLNGILTSKDELKKPQEPSGECRPMFILPPGTHVQVNVQKNEIHKSTDAATIDVIPETME